MRVCVCVSLRWTHISVSNQLRVSVSGSGVFVSVVITTKHRHHHGKWLNANTYIYKMFYCWCASRVGWWIKSSDELCFFRVFDVELLTIFKIYSRWKHIFGIYIISYLGRQGDHLNWGDIGVLSARLPNPHLHNAWMCCSSASFRFWIYSSVKVFKLHSCTLQLHWPVGGTHQRWSRLRQAGRQQTWLRVQRPGAHSYTFFY